MYSTFLYFGTVIKYVLLGLLAVIAFLESRKMLTVYWISGKIVIILTELHVHCTKLTRTIRI